MQLQPSVGTRMRCSCYVMCLLDTDCLVAVPGCLAWSTLSGTQKELFCVSFHLCFLFLLWVSWVGCVFVLWLLLLLCVYSRNDVFPKNLAERIHDRGTGRRPSIRIVALPSYLYILSCFAIKMKWSTFLGIRSSISVFAFLISLGSVLRNIRNSP